MFAECHHQIKSIRRNTLYNTSGNEEIIVQNLISYLSGRLQDITTTFRRSQNDYLKSKSWLFYRPTTVDTCKNGTANQGYSFKGCWQLFFILYGLIKVCLFNFKTIWCWITISTIKTVCSLQFAWCTLLVKVPICMFNSVVYSGVLGT